ncbi:sugar phosphate isomerase/epimerase [Paraburkholderia sp. D15]|uniref:sugar phosphate isomerase/epimerase family protein n=1 Tax=Paraburkholderia sp. D15 TaxID=2880218 RepID=UPI002479EBE7|nr:sugar phosphate isomerase/epimerase family protein [Paraburkholderia sp. D15]WGS53837.1 sugar phosphate isomerase/epimerase [Paraburkholderia sp. D15]
MTEKENALVLHATVAKYSNLLTDIEIMRTAGFDGVELSCTKIESYLDAGYSNDDLRKLLADVYVPGMGFLIDIERQGEQTEALWRRARTIFSLAAAAGAKGVQVLTGPVDVRAVIEWTATGRTDRYAGVLGYTEDEQIALTASNLAVLADMAREAGLLLYLETLSWSPVNGLDKSIRLIDRAERENVKIVIDYWHCHTSGVTPDDVARLDRNLIYGVHVCDSLRFDGGIPDEVVLRDVPTGEGVLDLQHWTDAVKATGYKGWWSCELFCRRQQQQNGYRVASELKALMESLIPPRHVVL